jgi:protein SCO1/2
MRLGLALAILVLMATPAAAGLSRAVLETIQAKPPPGAHLDLALSAPDSTGRRRTIGQILGGRPAFVNFVDYTCNTLCGTDLMLLADGIRRAGLRPSDFRLIVIGIDPKDPAKSAMAMENSEIPARLQGASAFLLPDQQTVNRATMALGFHYAYDRQIDQFAHPAVVYAIDSRGNVRQLLSPLALTAADLRGVLRNAAAPSLFQQIHSLCYGYDPATGTYNLRITLLLRFAAGFTLVLLAGSLLLLKRAWRWRQ